MPTVLQIAAPSDGVVSPDLNKTSPCWTSQEPTNVASVSQFAAPTDGEVSSVLNRTSLRWTSKEPTKVPIVLQIAAPSDGEAPSDLNRMSLRWALQELTEVATASQFAAPSDGGVSPDLNRTSVGTQNINISLVFRFFDLRDCGELFSGVVFIPLLAASVENVNQTRVAVARSRRPPRERPARCRCTIVD